MALSTHSSTDIFTVSRALATLVFEPGIWRAVRVFKQLSLQTGAFLPILGQQIPSHFLGLNVLGERFSDPLNRKQVSPTELTSI